MRDLDFWVSVVTEILKARVRHESCEALALNLFQL